MPSPSDNLKRQTGTVFRGPLVKTHPDILPEGGRALTMSGQENNDGAQVVRPPVGSPIVRLGSFVRNLRSVGNLVEVNADPISNAWKQVLKLIEPGSRDADVSTDFLTITYLLPGIITKQDVIKIAHSESASKEFMQLCTEIVSYLESKRLSK